MKQVDFWCRYTSLGASSRLRFFEYVPLLKKFNWIPACHSFFDDDYLTALYSGNKKILSGIVPAWFRRIKEMLSEKNPVPAVIEYEMLPYLPYFMEKNFLSKRKYILNFDDAVYLRYEKIPFLKNKFPQLLANASGIISANAFLTEKFRRYSDNILFLPTVPPHLPDKKLPKFPRLTLLWTGTPVTFPFLAQRSKALQMAAQQVDFDLIILGGASAIPGVKCLVKPWSQEVEENMLLQAHAGLMPLPDTPFARGKSAYKLLRYFQAGLPAIASPVGENNFVVEHNKNGFLFQSDDDFVEAVIALSKENIRNQMSACIGKSAEKYSIDHAAEKLAAFMDKTFY